MKNSNEESSVTHESIRKGVGLKNPNILLRCVTVIAGCIIGAFVLKKLEKIKKET